MGLQLVNPKKNECGHISNSIQCSNRGGKGSPSSEMMVKSTTVPGRKDTTILGNSITMNGKNEVNQKQKLVLLLTDEQKCQHQESMKHVQNEYNNPNYLCKVDRGEIPLKWKQHPTIEDPYYNSLLKYYEQVKNKQNEKQADQESNTEAATRSMIVLIGGIKKDRNSISSHAHCGPPEGLNLLKNSAMGDEYYQQESFISSRGLVDVTQLKELLREGYNDFVIPPAPTVSSTKANNKTSVIKFPTHVKSKTNLWDIANARRSNVHIIRPSHDGWGIKKVALIFCDDFIQRVYDLPWWHGKVNGSSNSKSKNNSNPQDDRIHNIAVSKKFHQAMIPIFDALGIQSTQVVRLLFAALPPGVTIPVHHDTGEWVKQTHRVHIPIFVPDNNNSSYILFQCGPIVSKMNRVDCCEGHVFEMNNQAKHMVSNCHTSEYRVHCILDYVSIDHPIITNNKRRIQLNPGERIYQTRRSIDRECDKGKRCTPSFFILGVQKCGTTSLYNYLTQHPLCIPSKKRETHGLDWRWPYHLVQSSSQANSKDGIQEQKQQNKSTLKEEDEEERLTQAQKSKIQRYLNEQSYYYDELQRYPSCITGDSTPSYFVHPACIIPRIKQIYPYLNKFLVILRHPTKRCYSHYQMVTDPIGTESQKRTRGIEWQNKTFEEVVMEDLKRMSSVGLIPYWDIKRNQFDKDIFNNFVGTDDERHAYLLYQRLYIPQNTGSHTPVLRGMYHLQLRAWLDDGNFSLKEHFHLIALERMTQNVHGVMKGVYEFLNIPPLSSIDDTTAKNTRTYRDPIPSSIEKMLNEFYQPQNEYFIQFVTNCNGNNDTTASSTDDTSEWDTKEWMTEEYWRGLWD